MKTTIHRQFYPGQIENNLIESRSENIQGFESGR